MPYNHREPRRRRYPEGVNRQTVSENDFSREGSDAESSEITSPLTHPVEGTPNESTSAGEFDEVIKNIPLIRTAHGVYKGFRRAARRRRRVQQLQKRLPTSDHLKAAASASLLGTFSAWILTQPWFTFGPLYILGSTVLTNIFRLMKIPLHDPLITIDATSKAAVKMGRVIISVDRRIYFGLALALGIYAWYVALVWGKQRRLQEKVREALEVRRQVAAHERRSIAAEALLDAEDMTNTLD